MSNFTIPAPSPSPTPLAVSPPKFLYLHGFASGPESSKGVALSRHFAERGTALQRLDLRNPTLETLKLSAIMRTIEQAIGTPSDRAVLFGSSLGGLAACRVAEQDPRVAALVLLAPAFRLMERWRLRMGDAAWAQWQQSGWLDINDYTTGTPTRLHWPFTTDAASIDERSGGWPDVRVPTLIIHGVNDDTVDVELSRVFARGKRHVRLVEVDDGHDLGKSVTFIAQESTAFLAPFGV